ncbi:MAG TPA: Gfo/Idh/MocA family oxidoreductase [Cyclobacteriaceae bacterium]|nr:Gfo/Idh/MocA family oxidoreductase [Cyclobacteriaceae bacterium]
MHKHKPRAQKLSRREFIGRVAVLSAFSIVPRFVLGGPGYRAPSDLLNLGFIGTGRQGTGLVKTFLRTGEAQCLAASDVYSAKLTNFLEQINKFYEESGQGKKEGCASYGDFRELLERKDIDAVVIATPDHWHAVHAIRAMKAGKDVYCEKPLALTIAEGRAMVKAARKYDRVVQTGSMQRSWPEFRQAVELVRNGYIGDITGVKVNVGGPPKDFDLQEQPLTAGLNWNAWLGPNTIYRPFHNDLAPTLADTFWPKWRDYKDFGGGGMTDWGAHMFDIVQWALGMDESGPIRITPPDGAEFKFLTYEYASGLRMTHEDFGKNNAIRFIGSKGQIDVQRRKIETTPAGLATQVIGANEIHVYRSEDHHKDWIEAIRKRSRPVCDVETGHRTASVCTLGNLAYELKRPLEWNPEKEKFKKDKEANKRRNRKMRKEFK